MLATVISFMIFFMGGLFVEILAEPGTKFTQMISKSLMFAVGLSASLFICVFIYRLIIALVALIIALVALIIGG